MSEPPPGYNAGESMLQGGTAPIIPVMGGGRVKNALKQIRKKHTRKGAGRKENATKRAKQAGGRSSHYELSGTDTYRPNKASGLIEVNISSIAVPTTEVTLPDRISINVIPDYVKLCAKLWMRHINAPFFSYSEFKSHIPTPENIGCNPSSATVVQYAPDRLCCVLSEKIESIVIFPAIEGNINIFKRIMSKVDPAAENTVYIFSPPFFGNNPTSNKIIFLEYLHKKNNAISKLYILMDYTKKTIEAAKLISKDIAVDFAYQANKDAVAALKEQLKKATQIENTKEIGVELITALHPMLEPTYIIYPYTVDFPIISATSVENSDTLSHEKYTEETKKLDDKLKEAEGNLKAAQARVPEAENTFNKATADTWHAMNSFSTTSGTSSEINAKLEGKKQEIAANSLLINALAGGQERSNLEAKQQVLEGEKTTLDTQLQEANAKNTDREKEYKRLQVDAENAQSDFKKAKKAAEQEEQTYKTVITKTENLRAVLDTKKPLTVNAASRYKEEKGGILFSAAITGEPILPAPYSGFDGPITYIETNDMYSARGSIAYRVDLNKTEPLLKSMNYKEYNLLLAPPMKQQLMSIFTLKQQQDLRKVTLDEKQAAFLANSDASHSNVPGVPIIVGTQDFTLRSPVPDVVNDWNNGIYTDDEAEYLNSMKMSPKLLKSVFGNSWKSHLSDHLSMISRSKCFKDPRLLLHADCQQAQGFVSQVLKYYMEHSKDIITLEKQQQDDEINRLKRALDAQAALLGTSAAVSQDSIFDFEQFNKTFFPGKSSEFLTSVTPIMVDRNRDTFTVSFSYEDKLTLGEQQAIAQKLETTLTIEVVTPPGAQTDGVYTWNFGKEISEHSLTTAARKYILTFIIDASTPYPTQPVNTINVIYYSKISTNDINLIKKTIHYTGSTPTSIPNMYTWTLSPPQAPQVVQELLNEIANTNTYYISFVRNTNAGYNDITRTTPNTNFKDNDIAKIFIGREIKNPSEDIFIDFSMNLDTGLSLKDAYKILEQKFDEITKQVNALPRDTAAFGGKYAFSSPA